MGKSVRGALSYNEQKVSAGKAELIFASRFVCDLSDLGFTEKLTRFERLNKMKPEIETNTLHLSLNFSPYDNIDKEKMQMIAWDYMKRIGFENQPFLVYKHEDAGHPHLHIVSTLIRPNGRRIKTHNLAKIQSESARKAIEKEFDLIPAESIRKEISLPLNPIDIEKAVYGEGETKQKISNIVREVARSYHFSSINEFNSILKQYNVIADVGKPGTKMFVNKGLVYSLLDKKGNKVGIPIKASSIYTSPTLKNLELKFERETNRKHFYSTYTSKVVQDLLKYPKSLTEEQLKGWLLRRKINCQVIKNIQGNVVDLQFIDNMKKVVLSCSDIHILPDQIIEKIRPTKEHSIFEGSAITEKIIPEPSFFSTTSLKLIQELLSPEYDSATQAPGLLKKKKKKKKRRS